VCLTSAAFYRLRQALVSALGLRRGEVRPTTSLQSVFPWRARRKLWVNLQQSTRLGVPDLQFPAVILAILLALGLMAGIAISFGLLKQLMVAPYMPHFGIFTYLLVAVGIGFVTFFCLESIARPFAVAFPGGSTNVADVTRLVVAQSYGQLAGAVGEWNRTEVWESLCEILGDLAGIPAKTIRPDHKLTHDSKMDYAILEACCFIVNLEVGIAWVLAKAISCSGSDVDYSGIENWYGCPAKVYEVRTERAASDCARADCSKAK